MKRLVIEEEKIIHNLEVIGEKSGGAPLIAVLKANAYGLGMLPMADLLRRQGVKRFGVTEPEDAVALRDGGFLTMDEGYFLHLTDVGREVAEQIYEKHRFFTDRLIAAGVDPATAERDACRIEHVISDESFERLKAVAKPES